MLMRGCADKEIPSVLVSHNCLHEVLLSNTPWLASISVKFLVTPPEVAIGSSHSSFFMFFQTPPRPLAGWLRIDVLIKRALLFQVEASPPESNPHHARVLSHDADRALAKAPSTSPAIEARKSLSRSLFPMPDCGMRVY